MVNESPKLSPIFNSREWLLVEDYTIMVEVEKKNYRIKVPKGHLTDIATTPRWTWLYTPPTGKYTVASVVHDWLALVVRSNNAGDTVFSYETNSFIKHDRKFADSVFLKIMEDSGVSKTKRTLMYWAVRLRSKIKRSK